MLKRSYMCNDEMGENCAIALAIRGIFPGTWVNSDDIVPFYSANDFTTRITLPTLAQDFICKFDISTYEQRLLLPEFDFTIDIPDEIVDMINIEDVYKSQTLELV